MAWWWKRQSSEASGDNTELDAPAHDDLDERAPRGSQPAIPVPRGESDIDSDPTERWDIIKQDLMSLDPDFFDDMDGLVDGPKQPAVVSELTDQRIVDSLRRLSIRYLVDEAGSLLAMWERHVVQIRREGPGGEILVLRARAYAMLPPDWNERAYRAVNEWNRTRRFLKAYVGEPGESGRVPLYGETQIPLRPGVTDALLDELIDCAAAVSGAYVDWLHSEAGVL